MDVRTMLPALALLSLSVAPAGDPARDIAGHDAAAPRITVDSTSPEWTRQVEWGLDRFRDAGLALPPITISVHQDQAPCGGNSGRYRAHVHEVHLCSPSDPGSGPARLITLHELAHAWAETQLSPSQQAAFLDVRDLEAWDDPQVPAHEWGAEHAAEVVSWGLMDEMPNIIRIHHAEPAELSIAYDALVGEAPLWAGSETDPVPR